MPYLASREVTLGYIACPVLSLLCPALAYIASGTVGSTSCYAAAGCYGHDIRYSVRTKINGSGHDVPDIQVERRCWSSEVSDSDFAQCRYVWRHVFPLLFPDGRDQKP